MTINVAKQGEPSQQMTVAEANQRIARGELSLNDVAWHEGLPKWVPIRQIRGINSSIAASTNSSTPSPSAGSTEWRTRRPSPSDDGGVWGTPDAPPLWNPKVCAFWSLPFSAAFGAILLARNWKNLGRPDKATSSMIWAVITILVIIANCVLTLMAVGGMVSMCSRLALLALVLVWYLVSAREQIAYVEHTLGNHFTRKSWAVPIALGVFGLVVTLAVAFFPLLRS